MIRQAQASDIPGIRVLIQAEPGLWHDAWADNVLARALTSADGLAFVWEEQGEILGFVCGHDAGFRGYLSVLVVAAHARRNGVGRQLVLHVQDQLTGRGCHVLIADVWHEADTFYRSLGWTTPSTNITLLNTAGQHHIINGCTGRQKAPVIYGAMPERMRMKVHYLVRGIIFADGNVLLAYQIGASNTFLPGGHIESGEGAESALVREIYEEIGMKATVKRFVGAVEHVLPEDRFGDRAINWIFEVEIPGLDSAKPPQSREDHLEFIWAEPSALARHNLQPYPLIECLTSWNTNRKGFWGTTL